MHASSLAQVLQKSGYVPVDVISVPSSYSPLGHGLKEGFVQGTGLVGCNDDAALSRFSSRPVAHQAQQHKDEDGDRQAGVQQRLLDSRPRQLRPPRHLQDGGCVSQCACLLSRHRVDAHSWQCAWLPAGVSPLEKVPLSASGQWSSPRLLQRSPQPALYMLIRAAC